MSTRVVIVRAGNLEIRLAHIGYFVKYAAFLSDQKSNLYLTKSDDEGISSHESYSRIGAQELQTEITTRFSYFSGLALSPTLDSFTVSINLPFVRHSIRLSRRAWRRMNEGACGVLDEDHCGTEEVLCV